MLDREGREVGIHQKRAAGDSRMSTSTVVERQPTSTAVAPPVKKQAPSHVGGATEVAHEPGDALRVG